MTTSASDARSKASLCTPATPTSRSLEAATVADKVTEQQRKQQHTSVREVLTSYALERTATLATLPPAGSCLQLVPAAWPWVHIAAVIHLVQRLHTATVASSCNTQHSNETLGTHLKACPSSIPWSPRCRRHPHAACWAIPPHKPNITSWKPLGGGQLNPVAWPQGASWAPDSLLVPRRHNETRNNVQEPNNHDDNHIVASILRRLQPTGPPASLPATPRNPTSTTTDQQ